MQKVMLVGATSDRSSAACNYSSFDQVVWTSGHLKHFDY